MVNIDIQHASLEKIISHLIGNASRDEELVLSHEDTSMDAPTREILLHYFLTSVKPEAFFQFTHNHDLALNEMYQLCTTVFKEPEQFIETSHRMAERLYDQANHPKIKTGELHIVLFNNVVYDDLLTEAIGIFKTEERDTFIQIEPTGNHLHIKHDFGLPVKQLDKGCIIFNTDAETGYRVLLIDGINKTTDAQYWKDMFLEIQPLPDEYLYTTQIMAMTKKFVAKELPAQNTIDKADQIDLLNRSASYFKTRDTFDKDEFAQEVLQNQDHIQQFEEFRESQGGDKVDNFAISPAAVKKQMRSFKSVLKLDNNFHVYIHGDRELIERGVDDEGRKYYKIFYEHEE